MNEIINLMNALQNVMEGEEYVKRLYAYVKKDLETNKRILEKWQKCGKDTTVIEIRIEEAEYALGIREDRPKLHRFVEKQRCKNMANDNIDDLLKEI